MLAVRVKKMTKTNLNFSPVTPGLQASGQKQTSNDNSSATSLELSKQVMLDTDFLKMLCHDPLENCCSPDVEMDDELSVLNLKETGTNSSSESLSSNVCQDASAVLSPKPQVWPFQSLGIANQQ